jgi:hypothetical protein
MRRRAEAAVPEAAPRADHAALGMVLRVQRAAGNQAALRWLRLAGEQTAKESEADNAAPPLKSVHVHEAAKPAGILQRQRAPGWDPGWADPKGGFTTGPNRDETRIGAIRRIPVDFLRLGNREASMTDRWGAPVKTSESAEGRAVVLLPQNLDSKKPVDVLLHLHGMNEGYRSVGSSVRDVDVDRVEQQLEASGRPQTIAVLPQGTTQAKFGPGGGFDADRYLAEVFNVLAFMGIWLFVPPISQVILSGHSGAGSAIAEKMMKGVQGAKLPSALRELVLFDAINGPNELSIVTDWVLSHLDADLKQLTRPGNTAAEQTTYLSQSTRFRGYHTGTANAPPSTSVTASYASRYAVLAQRIDGWFRGHAKELGGAKSALSTQLRQNYQVVAQGHSKHDMIVGLGDPLKEALDLPPASPARSIQPASPAPITAPAANPVQPTPQPQPVVQPARSPHAEVVAAVRPARAYRSQRELGIVPPVVQEALHGSGRPLDADTRLVMETGFGHDFSRVRVHTDERAAQSARAVNASAYTVGRDIVFGNGQYAPTMSEGKRLLAHELCHVLQQRGHSNGSALTIDLNPGSRLEREADDIATTVVAHAHAVNLPLIRPDMTAPRLVHHVQRMLQRQVLDTLDTPSGNHLGAIDKPSPTDNLKGEARIALKWLLDLWAIDVPTFNATVASWSSLPSSAQLSGDDLKPLVDAIKKNEHPSLANEVSNNFFNLNLPPGGAIGKDTNEQPSDFDAVANALRLRGFLSSNQPDDVLAAIKAFKKKVAEGKFGLQVSFGLEALRPDEIVDSRDKMAGQTFSALGIPIHDASLLDEDTANTSRPKWSPRTTFDKNFSIFVPKSTPTDKNQVHIFFAPNVVADWHQNTGFVPHKNAAAAAVVEQGLRAQSENSSWILIAVPALGDRDQPNFVTISTDEIQTCLAAAGRTRKDIDAIRLSAHSRGGRGLEHTIGTFAAAKPLIDLRLVEKITVFDASYAHLGTALGAQRKKLTAMIDPGKGGVFKPDALQLYDVTVQNVSGFKGTPLARRDKRSGVPDPSGVRAVSYVRFVADALARGDITVADFAALAPTVAGATGRILVALPARGNFSTKKVLPPGESDPTKARPPDGKIDLKDFIDSNWADLKIIDDPANGLKPFLIDRNLGSSGKDQDIDAHHWFVAELAHEAVE